MKVSITINDIKQGRRGHPQECPVGLAIQRSGFAYCCVAGPAIVLRDLERGVRAMLLPEAIQRWIKDFDQQLPVNPIEFELGSPIFAVCGCANGSPEVPAQCPRRQRTPWTA